MIVGKIETGLFSYDLQRMTQEVGNSETDKPAVESSLKTDDLGMPATKTLEYQPCQECTWNQITKVLFHSHVSQFDELVQMITVIGQHFETHDNVAVVVLGDSNVMRCKTKDEKLKPEEYFEASSDLNGNSERQEEDDTDFETFVENSEISKSKRKHSDKDLVGLQKKVYCCDECGKIFKERSSLWRHRKVKHEKIEKYMNRSRQVKEYTCPVCKEVIQDTYQRYKEVQIMIATDR